MKKHIGAIRKGLSKNLSPMEETFIFVGQAE